MEMLKQNDPVDICCGRPITRREISEIQETVNLFGKLSRKELSHTICEHLNWRTPSGTNKWNACLNMLKKFEKKGLLTLPAKKSHTRPAGKPIVFSKKTTPGPTICTSLDAVVPVFLTPAETREEIGLWNEYVHRHHYLGYCQPFGYTLRYFFGHGRTLFGCILFSGAAKAIASRDNWIGWTPDRRITTLPWVINNSRFLIFPWVKVKNLASHVLGHVSRQIRYDWHEKWGFTPVLMETFVDPARYQGTCYRAANWIHLGMTSGKGLVRKNKTYKTSPKHIFVKPLTKHFRKQLCEGNTIALPCTSRHPDLENTVGAIRSPAGYTQPSPESSRRTK